jgi:hypothetical protein
MLSDDFVRNRSARHRDARHVSACTVDSLANCFGDFVCLAGRESDLALTVADGNESVEGETTSTLYDLGNAVDRDDVLDELASAFAAAFAATAAVTSAALSVA